MTVDLRLMPQIDERVPSWDQSDLIDRDCPFCDTIRPDDVVAVRPDGMSVRKCVRCHCYFISPGPSNQQLSEFYRTYSAHASWPAQGGRLARSLILEDPFLDPRVRRLAGLRSLDSLSLLDVGCGFGQDMLRFSKLGVKVAGVDLNPEAVRFAAEHLSLDVRLGPIDDASGGPHDIVLLHDVVEHPLDPLALLEETCRLLNPAGLLSIWTPNATTVCLDDDMSLFRMDLEHMQYLSVQTVGWLAHRLGLHIIHLEVTGHPTIRATGQHESVSVRNACRTARDILVSLAPDVVRLRLAALRRARAAMTPPGPCGRYHLFAVLSPAGSLREIVSAPQRQPRQP